MIGIEGQFVLFVDIGDIQDAVRPEDLEMLQLTETAGLGLPTFILRFATNDEQVTAHLNEIANIHLAFGRTAADLKECNFYATQIHVSKEGDTRRHVEMQGLFNKPDYLSSNVVGITKKESAIAALTDLAERNDFELPEDNIKESRDEQYWIQPNIPDKRFGTHLWLHANLGDGTFPLVGISVLNEQFRILDAKEKITGEPDWEFDWDPNGAAAGGGGTKIAYNGHYTVRNCTGFVNAWVGYKREYVQFQGEEGTTEKFGFEVKPLLSLTKQMPTIGVETRLGDEQVVNENVDPEYNLTFQRNLAYLAQFSCFGTDVQFQNTFHPVRVCDLVYFRDDSTEDPKRTATEYSSGLFLISQVAHVFTSRRYSCTVKITREAPGDVA